MGLFSKFFGAKEEPIAVSAQRNTLCLPIEGEIIPLEQIGDGVFSDGVLGPGCGIIPAEETVYAPVDGVIDMVAETKHAIGMTSGDGIEVLIHVGMDTVDMKGDGFTSLVKAGDRVRCGQPILKFSIAKIKAAGLPATTAFIVSNSDQWKNVTVISLGPAKKLTPVLRAEA